VQQQETGKVAVVVKILQKFEDILPHHCLKTYIYEYSQLLLKIDWVLCVGGVVACAAAYLLLGQPKVNKVKIILPFW